jgi:hypothetical protein
MVTVTTTKSCSRWTAGGMENTVMTVTRPFAARAHLLRRTNVTGPAWAKTATLEISPWYVTSLSWCCQPHSVVTPFATSLATKRIVFRKWIYKCSYPMRCDPV